MSVGRNIVLRFQEDDLSSVNSLKLNYERISPAPRAIYNHHPRCLILSSIEEAEKGITKHILSYIPQCLKHRSNQ